MAAQEHYERREERQVRDAAGRPVERAERVERVEQAEAPSNVRSFPAERATNVNVAPRTAAAGPAYVDA